ncbi:CU044_2847 family protein [Streptomyces sp. LHD-70]|uniref:CU044_2847 family protein n=1 Tax=Streptomyces sp. LHD-70 TaxID=3072140 RepID=UPI00280C4BBF|nr:CU044_2847 family protein [Streptomyces sp. LHD-70]MDQ8701182.1 CU044_2847 family protein [Streptomyces sp. LHD-70]
MDSLVEFKAADGAQVVVAVAEDELAGGARLAARGDGGAVQATRTFENSLEGARAAAESALRVFRDGSLRPDAVEIEFGVKLTAEAGAVIAKSAVEGHLVVKLSWAPQPEAGQDREPRSA